MKKVSAAGGLVINQHDELLMIYKRSKWDLPKGHLDKNETFETCAIREIKEETGLENISVTRFIGVTEHEYYDSGLHAEAVKEIHWFEIKADKNEPLHPQEEESIEWIRWVPKSEWGAYLKNSYSNIRDIITKALKLNQYNSKKQIRKS
jgi:8-oxo-dGTP pyrophosphatase MutT (NUDIX family)